MSDCQYCGQGAIAKDDNGPVCPDCWEEGYAVMDNDEPEEDFHPAKAGDNPIWLGGMKYVRADRIEELEAKLEKAVEVLGYYALHDDGGSFAHTTLAELTGGNDD